MRMLLRGLFLRHVLVHTHNFRKQTRLQSLLHSTSCLISFSLFPNISKVKRPPSMTNLSSCARIQLPPAGVSHRAEKHHHRANFLDQHVVLECCFAGSQYWRWISVSHFRIREVASKTVALIREFVRSLMANADDVSPVYHGENSTSSARFGRLIVKGGLLSAMMTGMVAVFLAGRLFFLS